MEKLVASIKSLTKIPPVFFDGCLYIGIALFGFLATQFGTDEAYKFIEPEILFWIKTVVGAFSATLLSLKMYRSTAYADHVQSKQTETNNR